MKENEVKKTCVLINMDFIQNSNKLIIERQNQKVESDDENDEQKDFQVTILKMN